MAPPAGIRTIWEATKAARKVALPAMAAAAGGVIGAAVGGLGLLGAAVGGVAGFALQEGADWLADRGRAVAGKLPPRIVGWIPTDIRVFVGRREILDRLRAFVAADGSGVYTLHGLGGCGKSATLLRFLSEARLLETRPGRRSPHAVFVWSFYHSGDVEEFFALLLDYLAPLLGESADIPAAERERRTPLLVADYLARLDRPAVLVLDGLERIQEEKRAGNASFGTIHNPALRALLQRAGGRACGKTKILITTRLLIPELDREESSSIFVSDLNQLAPVDAVAIFRRYGVRGQEGELRAAAEEYNGHAYSVALLAQLLVRDFRGDVRRRDRIPQLDPSIQAPLARILAWYRERLPEESLWMMEAVSVFRGPVSVQDVDGVFPQLAEMAGSAQTRPGLRRTRAVLGELDTLGLLFLERQGEGEESCDLHPLIRDFFYHLLLNPERLHDRVWQLLSERKVGFKPTSAREIQALLELIFHALKSGRHEEAFRIYRERLGGYSHLGTQLADHPAGSKAIYTFFDTDAEGPLSLDLPRLTRLFVDGALYLKNEGRLEDAIELLQSGTARAAPIRGRSAEYVSLLLNLSGVELLRGRVLAAKGSAEEALREMGRLEAALDPADDNRLRKECDSRLASALAVRGDPEAEPLFRRALARPDLEDAPPRDYPAIRYAALLVQLGRPGEAVAILQAARDFAQKLAARMITARIDALLAFAAIASGDLASAGRRIDQISAWSTRADLHMFIQSWMVRASFALADGEPREALELAAEGERHAGDNGFTLEWLDLHLTIARAHLALEQWSEAARHAQRVIDGDDASFVYSLPGAAHPTVRYAWAEAAALALRRSALREGGAED
jgi:tetratricopeptide (TPR) repeat protein